MRQRDYQHGEPVTVEGAIYATDNGERLDVKRATVCGRNAVHQGDGRGRCVSLKDEHGRTFSVPERAIRKG